MALPRVLVRLGVRLAVQGRRWRRAVEARVGPVRALSSREARARRAFEVVVAGAVLVGAADLAQQETPAIAGTPLGSVEVDVARDGPSRLRLLPGIGPTRLRAILDDRATSGPVRSVDDLDRVPGLGPRTVEAVRRAGAVVRPPDGGGPTTVADADAAGRSSP